MDGYTKKYIHRFGKCHSVSVGCYQVTLWPPLTRLMIHHSKSTKKYTSSLIIMCIWCYLTDCITWMLSNSIKASGQGTKKQVSHCLDSLQCERNPLSVHWTSLLPVVNLLCKARNCWARVKIVTGARCVTAALALCSPNRPLWEAHPSSSYRIQLP